MYIKNDCFDNLRRIGLVERAQKQEVSSCAGGSVKLLRIITQEHYSNQRPEQSTPVSQ